MSDPATLTLLATATAVIGTGVSSYSQSQAQKQQGAYEASIYETNARLAEIQAKDAIRRGELASTEKKKQTKQLIGSQRARLAAQGQELGLRESDALLIQEETAEFGALDALEIRNNAWREAWGYRVQASDYLSRAKFARLTAKQKARNTLLTGGLQAAGQIASGAATYGALNPSSGSGYVTGVRSDGTKIRVTYP